MWYLAEILLAEPQRDEPAAYQCESCDVVFSAPTAAEAYRKAVAWGRAYAARPPATMAFLGVSHLSIIGDELGDGVEVCGRYFKEPDVWSRAEELVPPPAQLAAARWEGGLDTPLDELLDADQVASLKRRFGGPDAG